MSKISVAIIAALCLVIGMVSGGIFIKNEEPTTWKMAIMENGVNAQMAENLLALPSEPVVGDSAIAPNIFIKIDKGGEPYVGVLYTFKGVAVNNLPKVEIDSTEN